MKRLLTLSRITCFLATFGLLICSPLNAEPLNLDKLRSKIQTYHDSGNYERDIKKVAAVAKNYIHNRAQQNNNNNQPKKLAIILDIDETILSNYKNMVARQFIATKSQLQQEIKAANEPAIKPMLALYKNAMKQKIAVFFVTGRRDFQRQSTIKNLKHEGITNWTGIYLKPQNYNNESITPFKSSARESIEHKGYTIIASIGDQDSDLRGGHAEKTFKLPNPFYYLP